jgi:hypothetical protein
MFNANFSGLAAGEPGRKKAAGYVRPTFPAKIPNTTRDEYVRPADWLAMPDVAEGTQAITMLMAVHNYDFGALGHIR